MSTTTIRVIDAATVRRLLPFAECIDVVRAAMVTVSRGQAHLPLRHGMAVPNGAGTLGMMPGALLDPPCFGIKLVSLFPGNPARGLSSHLGAYLLYESESGQPLALMNASELTAIRTAAATAVATRALMRSDSTTLAILGTGEQARAHVKALSICHPFKNIRVWGRNPVHAQQLANEFQALACANLPPTIEPVADLALALRDADVVCTVTAAAEPFVTASLLTAGAHLNLVGSSFPDKREVDDDTVVRARFFVDFRASALAQAGELLSAIRSGRVSDTHIAGEIGEVLAGTIPGRQHATELTIYKSLGIAAQDLAAAWHVFRKAQADNAGVVASL